MSEIIKLLEQEMQASIRDINQENDKDITIEDVRVWFFETEKLVRTTANLSLDATASQAINQLRYAAHHVLKDNNEKANIIEAYKHCKRAYYDTLDLFILTLNDKFSTTLVYVEDLEKRTNIARKLKEILNKVQNARFQEQSRIGYYDTIQLHLIDGLNLLEDLSLAVSISAESQDLKKQLKMLKYENQQLRGCEEELKNEIKKRTRNEGAFFTRASFWFAMVVAISTAVGIVFQGALSPASKVEHSFNSEQPPTVNIKYPFGKEQLPTAINQSSVNPN